jgi:translocation and assembly module TamB
VRLPRKAPRALHPLEGRADIVDLSERDRGRGLPGAGAVARALDVRCRVVVPGRLVVKGERPAMNVELKADSTWQLAGGPVVVDGSLEVLRGTVEPIGGRLFRLERGRVTFPGAGVDAALLDFVARYDNPAAVVTVTVGGTVAKPSVQFSSQPAMDQAAIAMLLATGRAQTSESTAGVSTTPTSPEEAGAAFATAAVSSVFTGMVGDRLPVDQLSLETNTLRAGKFVSDKLFVGYARRWEAKPEDGENAHEVTAEYRLTRRWQFEVRYGDAQAGDASVVWSKDY